MDFWRAIGILNNRKWLIILSVIAATALTWGATQLVGSKWISEIKFMSLGTSPIVSIGKTPDGPVASASSQRDRDRMMIGQIEAVLKSREVVEAALSNMGPVQFPEGLLSRVDVGMTGPGLYYMRYTDSNKDRSQAVTNALAEAFVDRYQKIGTEKAQSGVDLLENQLKIATDRLTEARKKFTSFRSKRELVTGGSLGNEIERVVQRSKELGDKRDEILRQLAGIRAQLITRQQSLTSVVPTIKDPDKVTQNEDVKTLRKELNDKEKALRSISGRYADEHPIIRTAKADIETTRADLDRAMKSPTVEPGQTRANPVFEQAQAEIARLKQNLADFEAQLPNISSAYSQAQGGVSKYNNIDIPFNQMTGEIAQATEIRENILVRHTAAQMALDAARSQQPLAIADRVSNYNPPQSATSGRTIKLLLLAFVGALLGTCALLIALDSVDRRLKTVNQAELALPAKVIAAIPQPMGNVTYSTLARATEVSPSSLHSEAYRFLGLHLLSPRGPKVKALMVLSAKAEQGSTTTVTNLAITLAQAGKRVILVDANVRTAELHQVFELQNEFGFTDLLRDPSSDNLDKALRPTGVSNLQIITTGPTTDNAWQLFRSSNLTEISRRMHERADFVLYDTPSALIFTDALNLAPVVDAAFLCVRALEPLTGAEQRVTELLEQNNVQVLGSVLNDVPAAVVEGYHNYQHYYGRPAGVPAIAGGLDMSAAPTPLLETPHVEKGAGKNGTM